MKWSVDLTGVDGALEPPPRKEGAQQETSAKAVQQVAGAEVRTWREDVELKTAVSDKAVKSDKAGVPRHLWDCRVVKEGTEAWVQYTSGEWRPKITCVGGRCYRPSEVVRIAVVETKGVPVVLCLVSGDVQGNREGRRHLAERTGGIEVRTG